MSSHSRLIKPKQLPHFSISGRFLSFHKSHILKLNPTNFRRCAWVWSACPGQENPIGRKECKARVTAASFAITWLPSNWDLWSVPQKYPLWGWIHGGENLINQDTKKLKQNTWNWKPKSSLRSVMNWNSHQNPMIKSSLIQRGASSILSLNSSKESKNLAFWFTWGLKKTVAKAITKFLLTIQNLSFGASIILQNQEKNLKQVCAVATRNF